MSFNFKDTQNFIDSVKKPSVPERTTRLYTGNAGFHASIPLDNGCWLAEAPDSPHSDYNLTVNQPPCQALIRRIL